MKKQEKVQLPETLFRFALRSRILVVGRDNLAREKSRLQFILITKDLSENSLENIKWDFRHYAVVRNYTTEDLEELFGLKSTKVVGFRKSDLARSLYAALKAFRINQPSIPENTSAPKKA